METETATVMTPYLFFAPFEFWLARCSDHPEPELHGQVPGMSRVEAFGGLAGVLGGAD